MSSKKLTFLFKILGQSWKAIYEVDERKPVPTIQNICIMNQSNGEIQEDFTGSFKEKLYNACIKHYQAQRAIEGLSPKKSYAFESVIALDYDTPNAPDNRKVIIRYSVYLAAGLDVIEDILVIDAVSKAYIANFPYQMVLKLCNDNYNTQCLYASGRDF